MPYYQCQEAKGKELLDIVLSMKSEGFSGELIKKNLISELGVDLKTLPKELLEILE